MKFTSSAETQAKRQMAQRRQHIESVKYCTPELSGKFSGGNKFIASVVVDLP